ncbi:hypothetical protein Emtol_2203 [Emticicia oligotrophica DSM 17448]|uniref:Lipoprotein n=1 Tax=Emticicia oligotrophica (strain DSM 17448 / CIP 109782 / MTCC 6937 / GPTSA100-15) TaxID=929562 RepID=A0ABN4AMK3_EMTOG|nr:hypothetical protein [Emticicia oligotrophica]AFK03341.1 hypothetical protein Emtol_2203 [Emticicia oligotrophica DSM 17448]
MKAHCLVLLLLAVECSNPKKTETLEVLNPPSDQVIEINNSQKLLQTIMGTGEGIVRGIQFGDAIADVKKKEKAELFEEDETHVGYSFDTPNLETIDILYQKDKNNRVSGIELDIYMNTDTSNDSLKNEMVKQFTSLYGQPLPNGKLQTWALKPNGKVSIKVIKNNLDRGLEVRFTQSSKPLQ